MLPLPLICFNAISQNTCYHFRSRFKNAFSQNACYHFRCVLGSSWVNPRAAGEFLPLTLAGFCRKKEAESRPRQPQVPPKNSPVGVAVRISKAELTATPLGSKKDRQKFHWGALVGASWPLLAEKKRPKAPRGSPKSLPKTVQWVWR